MRNYHYFSLIGVLIYTMPPIQADVSNDITPTNNYTVTNGGITCVVMTAAIQLTIPYLGQTKNHTAIVPVQSSAKAVGLCSPRSNTISIYFNTYWQLSITVTNTSDSAYQWQKVSFTYTRDPTHFPNISSSNVNKSIIIDTNLQDGTMYTPVGGSFSCQQTLLQLNNSITMNISNLQYRAFGKDNSATFSSSNIQKCTVTMPAPDTDIALAVSVGIGLGVLIIVVVLIYIVSSKVMERYDNRRHRLGSDNS